MQQFPAPRPLRAMVEIAFGDILVRASETATATVEVAPLRHGRRADEEAAEAATVALADDRLEVRGPRMRALGLVRPGAVVVTIDLPAGSDLEAATMFGDIIGSGPLGRVVAKTRAGTVRVEDGTSVILESSTGEVEAGRVRMDGKLTASTGGIRVDDVAGSVRLKCGTGEVSLGRVAGAVEVKCPYGSIRVREAVSGSLELTSTYADLVIGIAEGTAAKLDISTSYGRIRNELNRTASPPETAERLEVTARSSYGSVTIRRA